MFQLKMNGLKDMVIKVKKLWMGHVSVRDYVLKKCISLKEDLLINLMGEIKTYPYRSLKTYLLNSTGMTFKSKFGTGSYSLIDLPW